MRRTASVRSGPAVDSGGGAGLAIRLSTRASRWIHAAIAAAFGGVLLAAAVLEPADRGYGTHTRLGLPGCLVCRLTGREACPSCGLTTAFCHAVRGRPAAAYRCNHMVVYLFPLVVVAALYCIIAALKGINRPIAELVAACVVLVPPGVYWLIKLLW